MAVLLRRFSGPVWLNFSPIWPDQVRPKTRSSYRAIKKKGMNPPPSRAINRAYKISLVCLFKPVKNFRVWVLGRPFKSKIFLFIFDLLKFF